VGEVIVIGRKKKKMPKVEFDMKAIREIKKRKKRSKKRRCWMAVYKKEGIYKKGDN